MYRAKALGMYGVRCLFIKFTKTITIFFITINDA